MVVQIKGEQRDLPNPVTAAGLVELPGLTGTRLAIEVNEEIVPGSRASSAKVTAWKSCAPSAAAKSSKLDGTIL